MPDGALLQSGSIGQDGGTILGLFDRLLLDTRGTVEVAAGAGRRVAGNDGKLGVGMPDGALLQSGSIGQDGGTILGLFDRLLLDTRGTVEVAAGAGRRVAGNDGELGVGIHDSLLLQSGSIGEDASPLLGLFDRLLLDTRGTVEVATSTGRRVAGNDGKLGVGMPDGALLQSGSIGQDGGTILGLFDRLLLDTRGTVEVAAGAGRRVAGNDGELGVGIHDRMLLQSGSIGEDASPLLGLFDRLLLDSRGTVEVAAGAGHGVAGNDGLFGMEVSAGHFFEGLGVGQNAKALGEELVELCSFHLSDREGRMR